MSHPSPRFLPISSSVSFTCYYFIFMTVWPTSVSLSICDCFHNRMQFLSDWWLHIYLSVWRLVCPFVYISPNLFLTCRTIFLNSFLFQLHFSLSVPEIFSTPLYVSVSLYIPLPLSLPFPTIYLPCHSLSLPCLSHVTLTYCFVSLFSFSLPSPFTIPPFLFVSLSLLSGVPHHSSLPSHSCSPPSAQYPCGKIQFKVFKGCLSQAGCFDVATHSPPSNQT